MSKKTFIHAENNNKILSSNEVRLYVPPEPEKMKVIIWGKELCNIAEWNDFLKCVEEKTRENDQLKQQLVEKDKEIKKLNWQLKDKEFTIKNLNHSLSVAPNANAGQRARIDELTKIVKEKDKEIEEILSSKKHFKTCAENMSDVLKTINSVLPKPQENGLNYKKVADDVIALIKEKDKELEHLKDAVNMCQNIKRYDIGEMLIENAKLKQNQTQLAIQELEKVKEYNAQRIYGNDLVDKFIDKRINALKGEKEVED